MKKILSVILTFVLLYQSQITLAQTNNAGFEGGIHKNEQDYKNEKRYKEMLFLAGQPILLEGIVELKIKDKKLEYDYELKSKDGTVTLEREIEVERIIDDTSSETQTIEVNNITDYDEEIVVKGEEGEGGHIYTLEDYQFHNSTIDDKQPVVNFYMGNWQGVKEYNIDGTQGKVIVNITGDSYGYNHYWGATETQKLHQDINYQLDSEDVEESIEWYGYSDVDVSFNRTKEMEYFDNLPFQTSFDGGYTQTEKNETVMQYTYNLPNDNGMGIERFETLPTQKKMFIPKYQDIKGHWAEWDIKKLAGLKVIDSSQKYFGPELDTKRLEFGKWIAIAMNLVEEDETDQRRTFKKTDLEESIFTDIDTENPDYKYIKAVKEKGIINGVGDNKFNPDGKLRRAEAITIVIRALGLERLAPNPPFITRFKDDDKIPFWAKKSIYVADQIGIAKGTPEGYVYPNEYMTKAEATTFINRVITYLQQDLKEDYREQIINY